MKAEISNQTGKLSIIPESETDRFALRKWMEQHESLEEAFDGMGAFNASRGSDLKIVDSSKKPGRKKAATPADPEPAEMPKPTTVEPDPVPEEPIQRAKLVTVSQIQQMAVAHKDKFGAEKTRALVAQCGAQKISDLTPDGRVQLKALLEADEKKGVPDDGLDL